MVEAMTRPFDSWGHEFRNPRPSQYYPRDQNPHSLRLPPPSFLANGADHIEVAPSRRELASHNQPSPQDIYVPAGVMPAHRPAQTLMRGSEDHSTTFSLSSRRPADTNAQLSPTYSSTISERSDEPPDYARPHHIAQEMSSPGPSLPSHFMLGREVPLRPPSSQEIQPMRPFSDAGSQNHRLRVLPQASSPGHQMWPPQPELRPPDHRMKIADLLSAEQNPPTSTPPNMPQRSAGRNPSSAAVTSTYRITIRQQPVAARSCGYGERDRRVIDPPPIVQMSIEDPTASAEEIKSRLDKPYYIMHCTIWNDEGNKDMSSMPEDYRTQRRLMGTVVSSPFAGEDEHGDYGCFFCFPDLSCRTPGHFRLQFSFMVLDPMSKPGDKTPVVNLAMSDVFTVYNAKDFPGMKASTALTKRLKEQGCLISIKKGNDRARIREESESDDEEDEDAAGGGGRERLKRVKKS
ncbi:hypothetical protein F4777DRAFT_315058 [Nemania sp. FL0916]|nr:hypothetical protein F4777DRAFT_315058 [Nemania sp. FL0916]